MSRASEAYCFQYLLHIERFYSQDLGFGVRQGHYEEYYCFYNPRQDFLLCFFAGRTASDEIITQKEYSHHKYLRIKFISTFGNLLCVTVKRIEPQRLSKLSPSDLQRFFGFQAVQSKPTTNRQTTIIVKLI